jgi:hypothetical protein
MRIVSVSSIRARSVRMPRAPRFDRGTGRARMSCGLACILGDIARRGQSHLA